MTDHVIPVERLHAASSLVVASFGSDANEVEAVSNNLIEANLTGHDSHGIGMLAQGTTRATPSSSRWTRS